jgi:fructan beta-fructosidase
VPRRLRLLRTRGGPRLAQWPAEALRGLRFDTFELGRDRVLSPGKDPLKGSGVGGECVELMASFENIDAHEFGLRVRVGRGQETVVGFDALKQKLFVDRTKSGMNFHKEFAARHEAPVEGAPEVRMSVLVDRRRSRCSGTTG